MNRYGLSLTLLGTLILAACGGGGGSNSSNNSGGGQVPATSAPQVISISPQLKATDVALDASITVNFDQPIDCQSFEQAFLLEDENNFSVDTTISCSGSTVSVAPTENLEKDTVYEIWVSTLLAGQNGTTLTIPFSTDFITVARVWLPAVELGDHGVGEFVGQGYYPVRALWPKIAMNPAGDALATWQVYDSDPYDIDNTSGNYGAYYDSELFNWGDDKRLGHKIAALSHPGVFTSGQAMAAGAGELIPQYGGSLLREINSMLNISGTWFDPQPMDAPASLNSNGWDFYYSPQDFTANSFRGIALWLKATPYMSDSLSGVDYELWSGKYIDGTVAWNPPKLAASTYTEHEQLGPNPQTEDDSGDFIIDAKIELDSNDNAVIAYRKVGVGLRATEYAICMNRLVGNTAWGTNIASPCFSAVPPLLFINQQVVVDNLSNAMVTWESHEIGVYTESILYFTQYKSLGSAFEYADPISGISMRAGSYEIAMNGAGEAVVVWATDLGAINAKFYDSLNGWGDIQELWPDLADRPQVAINDSGEIVVSFATIINELFARSYKEGQGWSDVATVSTSMYNNSFYKNDHDIAIDDSGNAIAVWVEQKAGSPNALDSTVFARRFE